MMKYLSSHPMQVKMQYSAMLSIDYYIYMYLVSSLVCFYGILTILYSILYFCVIRFAWIIQFNYRSYVRKLPVGPGPPRSPLPPRCPCSP